jgi:hypothetical protein
MLELEMVLHLASMLGSVLDQGSVLALALEMEVALELQKEVASAQGSGVGLESQMAEALGSV